VLADNTSELPLNLLLLSVDGSGLPEVNSIGGMVAVKDEKGSNKVRMGVVELLDAFGFFGSSGLILKNRWRDGFRITTGVSGLESTFAASSSSVLATVSLGLESPTAELPKAFFVGLLAGDFPGVPATES